MYIFEETKAFLYSDTQVPDIFISEYLPEMTGRQVKVYLYCLFLTKNKKKISDLQFAKTFALSEKEITEIFNDLLKKGLFFKKGKSYFLTDLKDKEINKLYKLRTSHNETDLEIKKGILSTINKGFFQGIMSISWYTNIEMWFNLYKFEDDVMYSLLNYCNERGLLKYSYVNAVAKNWAGAGVKNSFDLDEYFYKYKLFKEISTKIARKLKRKAPFTEYEESYIKKWVDDYGYSMEIIEMALKNAVKISNPNLMYFHKILSDWNKKGYRTKAQVEKGARAYTAARNGNGTDEMMVKKRVREYYNEIKKKNAVNMEKRKNEVFTKEPEIKKLLENMADMSIESLSVPKNKKQTIFSKIEKMKIMVSKLLEKTGYSTDYMEPVYDCKKCSDSGVVPDGSNCECRKKIVKKIKA